MARNLKALGLALLAAFAMSAVAASGAQANAVNPTFKDPSNVYPAFLDATGTGGEIFRAFGAEVTCAHSKFEKKGTLTGEPIPLNAASTSIEATPTYTTCHTELFGTRHVTVTHNGCTYKFHTPKTEGTPVTHASGEKTDFYTVTTDIICPVGKKIEVHVYESTAAHTAGNATCTLTIGAQTGLKGLTADVQTKTPASANRLVLTGTVVGIAVEAHRNSFLCPGSGATPTENAATYELPAAGVPVTGTTAAGAATSIEIG